MLSDDEIITRLNNVFRDVFDDEGLEVSSEMTAVDVDGWDSLSHIRLVLAVEKEFGIKFRADDIGNMAFVSDMIDVIRRDVSG